MQSAEPGSTSSKTPEPRHTVGPEVESESSKDPASNAPSSPGRARMRLRVGSVVALLIGALAGWLWPLGPAALPTTRGSWWLERNEVDRMARLPMIGADLHDVFFVDELHGWAVGDFNLVLATEDGGLTWRQQYADPAGSLQAVHFFDLQNGLAAGNAGLILRTSNGGVTWSSIDTRTDTDFEDMQFVDASTGYAVGGSSLYTTSDSGRTWLPVDANEVGSLRRLALPEPGHIRILALRSKVWATDNAGVAWRSSDLPESAPLPNKPQQQANAPPTLSITDQLAAAIGGEQANDLAFIDRNRGWVVGQPGLLFRTTDGGTTWEQRFTPTDKPLNRVTFLDERQGWVVGDEGTLFRTRDSGETWELSTAPTDASFNAVHFTDSNHGWVVGCDGVILATRDGGVNWTAQSSLSTRDINHFVPVSDRAAWIQDSKSRLSLTRDGGRTWRERAAIEKLDYDWIHFADEEIGWAFDTEFQRTRDGGLTWEVLTKPFQSSLRTVFAHAGDEALWCVAFHGFSNRDPSGSDVYFSPDGGTTWSTQYEFPDATLKGIFALDSQQVWVLGNSRQNGVTEDVLVSTIDGGLSWQRQVVEGISSTLSPSQITFSDSLNGWAYDDPEETSLFRTDDGGKTWSVPTSGPNRAHQVFFSDSLHGWIIDQNFQLHATADGGSVWSALPRPETHWIGMVHFVDSEKGWALGPAGAVILTADGGKTWSFPRVSMTTYPPPLVLALVFLSLVGFGISYLRIGPKRRAEIPSSIENALISDRPLDDPARAPRWMRQLADGIARFVANPSTAAPLTLAVSGAWGQGKSSLMQLISRELRQRDHHPVWFNAWHHQDTDDVFASILGTIKEQAIPPLVAFPTEPPFLAFNGLAYRIRLAWHRGRRLWIRVLLLHAAVVVVGAWAWSNQIVLLSRPEGLFTGNWVETLIGLTAAGAAIAPLMKLLGILRAFGIDPSRLLTLQRGNQSASDLALANVFKTRFATEFSEVTHALGHRRMVIFIDDLDRCDPAHLLAVLEATNQINSYGECFIVLGLQRDTVLASLTAQLKAARLGPGVTVEDWLEKLVQIEVPLPSEPDLLENWVQVRNAGSNESSATQRWRLARTLTLGTLAGALFAGLLTLGFSLGEQPSLRLRESPSTSTPRTITAELDTDIPGFDGARVEGAFDGSHATLSIRQKQPIKNDATEEVREAPNIASLPTESTAQNQQPRPAVTGLLRDSDIIPQPSLASSMMPFVVALLILFLLLSRTRYRRDSKEVDDSEDFLTALRAWKSFLGVLCDTPRDLKRQINRLRFDAMLLRTFASSDGNEASVSGDVVREREAHLVAINLLQTADEPAHQTTTEKDKSITSKLTPEERRRATAAQAALADDPIFAGFARFRGAVGRRSASSDS